MKTTRPYLQGQQSVAVGRNQGTWALSEILPQPALREFGDTQKRHRDGSLYRIPYYKLHQNAGLQQFSCQVKLINADDVERVVVQKLSDLSQNEAFLKRVDELNGDLKRKTGPLGDSRA